MEGNPHPGAVKGRMSFQSFNPSIDKLNEAAENPDQPKVSSANTGDANNFERENGSSCIGPDGSNGFKAESEYNGDLKRKNPESVTEVLYPNKSPKTASREGDQRSSPNNRNGSYKQKKHEKLDFNVLRRPNVENRKA
ncbi:hypothetical protein IFM89_029913 [Coptis chinensis]|uniref:Uncharacterized protein n=1 Tax=Coptis chinensis TaxID=261450 RepID=A0A835HKR3_9MAGN|nr:hypothetical protein IFM89_029913 [Coptis chinensis]